MNVSPFRFGKDHWSLLAYIETLCVDNCGVPDFRKMRCDQKRHPQFAHLTLEGNYSTRLKGYFMDPTNPSLSLPDHDDWDCVDDLMAADLVKWGGTGINPVFSLTKRGLKVASALRAHKARGGHFAGFELDPNLMQEKLVG